MNVKNVKPKTVRAAMQAAATRGGDPRNSHVVQARFMEQFWRMDEGRTQYRMEEQRRHRSEAQANQELAMEISINGHSRFKQAG